MKCHLTRLATISSNVFENRFSKFHSTRVLLQIRSGSFRRAGQLTRLVFFVFLSLSFLLRALLRLFLFFFFAFVFTSAFVSHRFVSKMYELLIERVVCRGALNRFTVHGLR